MENIFFRSPNQLKIVEPVIIVEPMNASLYLRDCWLVLSFILDVRENFGKTNRCDIIVYVELHQVSSLSRRFSSETFEIQTKQAKWNRISSSDVAFKVWSALVVYDAFKVYIFKDFFFSAILQQVELFWYRCLFHENKIANRVMFSVFRLAQKCKYFKSNIRELAWDTIFLESLRLSIKFLLKLDRNTQELPFIHSKFTWAFNFVWLNSVQPQHLNHFISNDGNRKRETQRLMPVIYNLLQALIN